MEWTPCFACGQPKPFPAFVCQACGDDPVAYAEPTVAAFTEEVRAARGPGNGS